MSKGQLACAEIVVSLLFKNTFLKSTEMKSFETVKKQTEQWQYEEKLGS